jgi:sterol 24-C-methyltransferase
LSFPDNTFDAIYAIEATCHAPVLEGVYSQMFRVAKPGAVVGIYEWVMTDRYDESNPTHRSIRHGIERGNGISNMVTRKDALQAFLKAGFTLMHDEDLAERNDARPWYVCEGTDTTSQRPSDGVSTSLGLVVLCRNPHRNMLTVLFLCRYAPLSGDINYTTGIWDVVGAVRMTRVGRFTMEMLLSALEMIRMAPSGTAETARELSAGADALVAGGKEGLFTPMYLMVGRKPM